LQQLKKLNVFHEVSGNIYILHCELDYWGEWDMQFRELERNRLCLLKNSLFDPNGQNFEDRKCLEIREYRS